jgi:site-specific DNA recombinase
VGVDVDATQHRRLCHGARMRQLDPWHQATSSRQGYDTDASYIKTPGSDRRYDDGGLSGASLDRPALQKLLADVGAGKINIVVVYKVDRLTRSLADFAKLVELFDQHGVSFVSIT